MEEQLTMEDEEEGGVEVEVESDEDIYGDLESDIFFPPTKRAKQSGVQDEEHEKILKENQRLRAKLKQLNKENKTYSSNISALYLTAKNEIEKKNFIIKNLQEKLKTITQSKSSLSKEAVDEIITKCHEALLETQAQVTLDEIKKSLEKASVLKDSKRKRIKFGNMSVYFFREQGCFQRQETVEFPKSSTQTSSMTSEEQTQRVVDHNHEASQSQSFQSSRVPNHADMRIKPHRQSPSVVSNLSNPTRPTSLSITAENSIVPGGRYKRDSSSNRSGSGERPGGFDNRRRLSSEQENNNKVDDDRPPNKRSDYRSNRDYSPSAEKHNTRTNRGGTRGKGADYKDNHRTSDYRSRTSKRFSNDSRHSDKRHRSRSR